MLKSIFFGAFFFSSMFNPASAGMEAEIIWNPESKTRTEAFYESTNGVRGKLLAKKYYNNFVLGEIFVDGQSWSGKDESALDKFDKFIKDNSEVRVTVENYSGTSMRRETVARYIGAVVVEKLAEKIFANDTNELREIYVDKSSHSGKDKAALEKVEVIFKNYAKTPNCVEKLMAKPSCVNRLNATNICKRREDNIAYIEDIQQCISKYKKGILPTPTDIVLCTGTVAGSSKVKDNETLCSSDKTKDIMVNDTKIPKKPENNSTSKDASNANSLDK